VSNLPTLSALGLNIHVITRTGSGAKTGKIRTSVLLLRDETCVDTIPSERAVSND